MLAKKIKYKKYAVVSLIVSLLSFGFSYLIFLLNKPELQYDNYGMPGIAEYSNIYGDILFYIGVIAFIIFIISLIKSIIIIKLKK